MTLYNVCASIVACYKTVALEPFKFIPSDGGGIDGKPALTYPPSRRRGSEADLFVGGALRSPLSGFDSPL